MPFKPQQLDLNYNMADRVMKYTKHGFLALLILLLASGHAMANIADSILVNYRGSEKFGFGDFVWQKSSVFYLAQKKNPAQNQPFALRKLSNAWDILQFDSSLSLIHLKAFYNTVVPASSLWKFSDDLQELLRSAVLPKKQLLRVSYLPKTPIGLLSVGGVEVKTNYADYNCADVLVNDNVALQLLAGNSSVIAISVAGKVPHTEQALERVDLSANSITAAHAKMPEVTGMATVVSLKENLFDTTDIDFKNRFFSTDFSASVIDNHAAIMATMLGGSGNSYYSGKGAAWQTAITSANFSNLMPEPKAYYNGNGIDVQNHSYGTGIENQYAEDAAAYDLSTWEDTSLLHVFSAGNSGTSTSGNGVYNGIAGWANLTGSFKMSKNSISVGGTDSFFVVQTLSSKGPAYDGRIKPELVAFGEDGTSGAAAITTGCALLLQQKLFGQNGVKPSAALVKALLINGADDSDEEGPGFATGYGNVNVLQSLQITDAKKYYAGVLTSGSTNNYTINIPSNAKDLRVTLVWTDTPATALSSSALINDLDIELHNQHGIVWYPWIKSFAANKDSLQLPAVRGVDHLNTVEMVSIKQPAQGAYNIVVKAYQMVSLTQSFSVVYQWQIADSATITFPTKTDVIFANEAKQMVRWQSSFSNAVKGQLAIKIVGENTWKLLTDTLPMQQLWNQWKVPDTVAKAQLRITASNKIFTSDTFIISRPLRLQVGFVCEDSILIYWDKQPTAQRYNIYNLADTFMRPITSTANTFYAAAKSSLSNNYLAVAPVVGGEETARSYTIDMETQGVGCYIQNFTADLVGNSVELQLSLGSEYNVKSIVIEKQVGGIFTDRELIAPTLAAIYSYTDDTLQQGVNAYRIKIVLADGHVIYSQVETIYYTSEKLYVLYPNPVSRQQNLFIINHFTDGNLYASLYDMAGRLIKKYNLPQQVSEVYIKDIPAGVYLLLFNDGNRKMGVEKLVVW